MTTPVDEKPEPAYHTTTTANPPTASTVTRSSDEEGTVINEDRRPSTVRSSSIDRSTSRRRRASHAADFLHSDHLRLNTNYSRHRDADLDSQYTGKSPSQARADSTRLNDELRMAQIERAVSQTMETVPEEDENNILEPVKTKNSRTRDRSTRRDPVDAFDHATNPMHETTKIYCPPAAPATKLASLVKKLHKKNVFVRWLVYITPVTLILLIPLLVGALYANGKTHAKATIAGVELIWFSIWFEIVWLTLWLARIIAKLLPHLIYGIASVFTNTPKKWRDLARQLEIAATLFFWWLAIEISFLPTMIHHQVTGSSATQGWQDTTNRIFISILVLATLNLISKFLIQLIAISFHQRTYQERIEMNKFQINSLVKMYVHSKSRLGDDNTAFEEKEYELPPSGARTPGAVLKETAQKAQKTTKKAVDRFGDIAGKIAGDFTGRAVRRRADPSQVVLTLLHTKSTAAVLARRLYRTFKEDDDDVITPDSLQPVFELEDERETVFQHFDKDMNGDISMEEFESVCQEIGHERTSITSSLKDLDSVVSKLDDVFMVIVVAISIIVLITLISSSAASGLTTAGTTVLGLSWLLSQTASEFLQSIIFVFVKHPFDVGDRVSVYGNTGASLKGDDYFVKSISLLFTEFKKMEGHVVQAPNNVLNQLFILNQRRSGGLAEAVPMTFKFGTTLEQIEKLKDKLLDFVQSEKREYQGKILTEMRDVIEAHAITLNIVFFFKSNWQNELLRLQRRNKFMIAIMVAMQECGIEGPRMRYPGMKDSFPVYMQHIPFDSANRGRGGEPDYPRGRSEEPIVPRDYTQLPEDQFVTDDRRDRAVGDREASIASRTGDRRNRAESISQTARRHDFSLGVAGIRAEMNGEMGDMQDLFDGPRSYKIPINVRSPSRPYQEASTHERRSNDIAHSTGRRFSIGMSDIRRANTELPRSSSSVHRNRFFGRVSRELARPTELDMMESGMAGIPEGGSSRQSVVERLDPRTGIISTRAMRMDTNDTQ